MTVPQFLQVCVPSLSFLIQKGIKPTGPPAQHRKQHRNHWEGLMWVSTTVYVGWLQKGHIMYTESWLDLKGLDATFIVIGRSWYAYC